MNTEDYITRSSTTEWEPLIENGNAYGGIFVKSLRFDTDTNRSKAILLKFEARASYPYHTHPGGEEILVLNGSCEIGGAILNQGDYLYTPPGGKHGVTTDMGCVLFLSIPEEVVLLQDHY